MTAGRLSRRGVLGATALGLSAVPKSALTGRYSGETVEDQLCACLGRLWLASSRIDDLPDDDPLVPGLIARMDAVLLDAAGIVPDTSKAFGLKAKIVRDYGGDWPEGDAVRSALLADLMQRGGLAELVL